MHFRRSLKAPGVLLFFIFIFFGGGGGRVEGRLGFRVLGFRVLGLRG